MGDTYTAKEIAAALGCKKRTVLIQLANVPAATRPVRGQNAKAWALDAIPPGLKLQLERAATAKSIATAEGLLASVRTPEPEPVPCPASPYGAPFWDELLGSAFEVVPCQDRPRAQERLFLWREICTAYATARAGVHIHEARELKPALLAYLGLKAPALARSGSGLSVSFERKIALFDAGGRAALQDRRALTSGNYRSLCPACWDLVRIEAGKWGGIESQAWRVLKEGKKLCPACDALHRFDPYAKSQMPATVRNRVTSVVESALEWQRSQAAGRMDAPSIDRDYSTVAPGDTWWADDVTWNHAVWDKDEKGRKFLCRPECLYLADFKTSYPIHFLLIPGQSGTKASYNATHVRLLLLQAHDLLGLPHSGYLFENGVWAARMVADPRHDGKGRKILKPLPWFETEEGLKSLHDFVQVKHALPGNPRSKPEGDFLILQRMMRELPGFVGFNERFEKTDEMKRYERRVAQGEDPATLGLMSLAQFKTALERVFLEFANALQNGKRLPGLSPSEVFNEAQQARPFRRLAPEDRWILATHRFAGRVGRHGLTFRKRHFANGTLDEYRERGEPVQAFYSVECPDQIVVMNKARTHRFVVRGIAAPADADRTAAGREALAEAKRSQAAFTRSPRVLAGKIQHALRNSIVRDNLTTDEEKDHGRFMEQATTDHVSAEDQERKQLRQVHRLAGELGVELRQQPRNARKVKEGLQWEREIMEELEREEAEQ